MPIIDFGPLLKLKNTDKMNLLFADQFHSLAQEGDLDENIVMYLLP